jgi:hypothetical protein
MLTLLIIAAYFADSSSIPQGRDTAAPVLGHWCFYQWFESIGCLRHSSGARALLRHERQGGFGIIIDLRAVNSASRHQRHRHLSMAVTMLLMPRVSRPATVRVRRVPRGANTHAECHSCREPRQIPRRRRFTVGATAAPYAGHLPRALLKISRRLPFRHCRMH